MKVDIWDHCKIKTLGKCVPQLWVGRFLPLKMTKFQGCTCNANLDLRLKNFTFTLSTLLFFIGPYRICTTFVFVGIEQIRKAIFLEIRKMFLFENLLCVRNGSKDMCQVKFHSLN